MIDNKNDLLQKFIENEKKSKTLTLISVIIFIVLICSVFYLAYEFTHKSIELKKLSEQLDTALKNADDENESHKYRLKVETDNYVSLKQQYDSLLVKFVPATLRDSVKTRNKNYTVYVQYIDSYDNESKSVLSMLQQKKYNVPGRELMKNRNFLSSVKYFNNADKAEAQRIADIINTDIGKFSQTPIRIVKNKLDASPGQLEVWLGETKPLDTKELLQKYNTKMAD